MEIWKDIDGYKGLYQVSNLGRVKSLERKVFHSIGRFLTIKERLLKTHVDSKGYYHVGLSASGKVKNGKIHQLVAMSFLGHKPDGTYKLVVNHIDGNKLNNSVENIELVTQRENMIHYRKTAKSSSKYVGVYLCKKKGKYISQIKINGKSTHLGIFENELDAHNAYLKAKSDL